MPAQPRRSSIQACLRSSGTSLAVFLRSSRSCGQSDLVLAEGRGTYGCLPRLLPVLFLGFLLRVRIVLCELLGPVFPDQGIDVDLEMGSRFLGFVVWILLAKACNEHLCGRLVPRVGGRSLQMKSEIVDRPGIFVAQRIVGIRFVSGYPLLERAISRGVQQECGVFADVLLNGRQSESRETWVLRIVTLTRSL